MKKIANLLLMIAALWTNLSADPLLAIVLMVKNEETVIRQTLQPFIDAGIQHYFIFDTGSTDKTIEIVKEYFKQHNISNAHIAQEPFVDFATSRNRALELAEATFPDAYFMLMPDAEWYMHNVVKLIDFCENNKNDDCDAYLIPIDWESKVNFFIPRLIRAQAHLRFYGAIHESLKFGKARKLPEDISFEAQVGEKGLEARNKRLLRDLNILLKEYEENHLDSKTIYYLGQTYASLGEYLKSYYYYRLCVKVALPDKNNAAAWCIERAFLACYLSAHCAMKLGKNNPDFSWDLALSHFLEAFSIDPRAEPLMSIAFHYWDEGNLELCFLFARHAAELPYPTDVLGHIENDIYTFKRYELLGTCAARLGKLDISQWAFRRALEAQPHAEHIQ